MIYWTSWTPEHYIQTFAHTFLQNGSRIFTGCGRSLWVDCPESIFPYFHNCPLFSFWKTSSPSLKSPYISAAQTHSKPGQEWCFWCRPGQSQHHIPQLCDCFRDGHLTQVKPIRPNPSKSHNIWAAKKQLGPGLLEMNPERYKAGLLTNSTLRDESMIEYNPLPHLIEIIGQGTGIGGEERRQGELIPDNTLLKDRNVKMPLLT